ncbi:MAG: hypothetical protein GY863_25320 [bacterium]|nr:hypothetical protein [bacterium]
MRKDEYGYDVVWHTGSMRGVNNIIKMVPSENIAVTVLINAGSPLRNKIPNDIIGVLLPDYGEKWKEVRDKARPAPAPYKPAPELIGEWKGEIVTYEEKLPVTFVFQEDGDIHVKIENQFNTLLNNVRYRNGQLTGNCYGTIPSGDAKKHPHVINMKLILNNDRFNGYFTTYFTTERSYGNLSSYIYLDKIK